MKRIRLSEDDYILIFPWAKPIEIRQEFGEHSHCIAQIRNKYKKLRYDSQYKALRLWREQARLNRKEGYSLAQWERHIDRDIQQRKEDAFKKVRAKLDDRIRLYAGEES